MTRNAKIILFGSIALSGTLYLIYRSIRNNTIFAEMQERINQNGVMDNQKLNTVLSGAYHSTVASSGRNYAVISESQKRQVAEQLNNALKGWGTNEGDVFDAFESLLDKVAISMVASYYRAKYNQSLKSALEKDLSDADLNKVYGIINSKFDVRWIK